uniref:Uncharacterized protein n=1 Tax=Elaeophora elaphi TaxID=1147741 RepID=A0A0R3RS10_9BILA
MVTYGVKVSSPNRVTFSTEEANDEVGNSGRRERPVNRSTDVKAKTIVSRSMEANEEAVSNWNQSKRNKLHNHSSELSLDKNRSKKDCMRIKQSRGDPEDDTLYEVPLKMPEFDLVPSRLEESVR